MYIIYEYKGTFQKLTSQNKIFKEALTNDCVNLIMRMRPTIVKYDMSLVLHF